MMKRIVCSFLLSASLTASFAMPSMPSIPEATPSIRVNHRVLAQVGDHVITSMDLKQNLDMLFYQNYPEYISNDMARAQFYQSHWQAALDELINVELIMLDAEEKQVPTSDGEVHQEMQVRYGPSIAKSLELVGVSYEKTAEAIRKEITVQKLIGHMVYSKAFQALTPSNLQKEYQELVKLRPEKKIWKYQMITAQGDSNLHDAHQLLQQDGLDAVSVMPVSLDQENNKVKVSPVYETEENDLSASYLEILSTLQEGEYSEPIAQINRKGDEVQRIFVLHDKVVELPPTFAQVEQEVQNRITNREAGKARKKYVERLRKKHPVIQNLPEGFSPFSM